MEEMKTQEQVHNSVVIDDGRIESLDEFLAPEQLYNDLITRVRKYHPSGDISLIEKAYNVANDAHKGQTRKSGEPYIIHPLYVAIILADLELDKETIVAGLLHDVVEDTVMTIDEIKAEFGDDVALLVDGVTKLQMQMDDANLDYSAIKLEMQAENLRKMFLAMAKDIRVIIIKLADRLHNLRTLQYQTAEKQVEKARETMDIYAPLANRLGISKIQVEMDDLCMQYLYPDIYRDIRDKLDEMLSERGDFINEIVAEVKQYISEADISAEIDGRVKHIFSIYKKMKTQGKTLDQIYDIVALRIKVETVRDCYAALGIIHEKYKPIPGRFKDYIAMPKANLYQSLHTTLIGHGGRPFEIQIRTYEMHRTAEFGIAAHWKYKESGSTEVSTEEEKLNWLREILEWQNDSDDNHEFMNAVKSSLDLFQDHVYCFTPAGDVKTLPRGSNTIDFAYAVHTAVGNKMIGARINGRVVPIETEIRNGDRVDIITSQNSKGPSRDWLAMVKSTQARNKINQWYKNEYKADNLQKGKAAMEDYCRAKGINLSELLVPDFMEKTLKRYNYTEWDTLMAAVGHGGLREGQIVNRLLEEKRRVEEKNRSDSDVLEEIRDKKSNEEYESPKGTIKVRGIHDVAVRFSKCCSPVPGDDIVGFVTRGRGISIHRTDCINVVNMSETDRVRLIDAEWVEAEGKSNFEFTTEINVYAMERNGLIFDLSKVFNEEDISIKGMLARTSKAGKSTIDISFNVKSKDDLNRLVSKIRNIQGVLDIQRPQG